MMELKAYWRIICRRKWLLIFTVVTIPMMAYIMMRVIPPIYKSETKLWVRMNTLEQKYLKDISDIVGKFEFTTNENSLGTIEELLNNSESVHSVITELALTNRKGEKMTPAEFTNPNKIMLMLHLQEKGYREEQVTDSDVIKITGYSTSPSEANAIASRVVQKLVLTFNIMYNKSAVAAGKILRSRLDVINKELDSANRALERFKTEQKIYSLSAQTETLISEISTLESSSLSALTDHKIAKNALRDISDASLIRSNDVKDVQVKIENSTLIDNFKNQLLSLETDLAKLMTEVTSEHPDVQIRRYQIELTKEKIKNEISRSFKSQIKERDSLYEKLSAKYSDSMFSLIESEVNIKYIDHQLKTKRKELGRVPELERELNGLQWSIDNLKSKRDALQADYQTTRSAEELELANPFVFQPPTLFENAKDNLFFPPKSKKLGLAISVFLGFFFGLFLVFGVEYWSINTID